MSLISPAAWKPEWSSWLVWFFGLLAKEKKDFNGGKKAQPQQVSLDISALAALGYAPKIGIEEGLKRTFEWYERYFAQPAIVI